MTVVVGGEVTVLRDTQSHLREPGGGMLAPPRG